MKTWSALSMAAVGVGLAVVVLAPTWTGAVAMSGSGLVALGVVGLIVTTLLWWAAPTEARTHHSDEFGQLASAKLTDAPANLMIDAIVENESGTTPGPPPFSLRTAAIGLMAIFLVGLALAWTGQALRVAMLNHDHATTPPQRVTTYDPAVDRAFTR